MIRESQVLHYQMTFVHKGFDETRHLGLQSETEQGSARSSILGEASINLAGHMSSKVYVPVSLPLRKCVHGTTIQVEVQCLAPRTKLGTENCNEVHSITEDVTADDDIDNMSNGSSYTYTKSFGSSSGNLSHRGEHGSRWWCSLYEIEAIGVQQELAERLEEVTQKLADSKKRVTIFMKQQTDFRH